MDEDKAKKIGYREDVECCYSCEYSDYSCRSFGETYCFLHKENVKTFGVCSDFDHEE